jgi:hypothetical protein
LTGAGGLFFSVYCGQRLKQEGGETNMTNPSEKITAKQYSTAVVANGVLFVSIVSVAHSFAHIRIGAVGANNLDVERLNLGEFVQYECPDGALYEIRLLSVEGFDTATLLVTRVK